MSSAISAMVHRLIYERSVSQVTRCQLKDR